MTDKIPKIRLLLLTIHVVGVGRVRHSLILGLSPSEVIRRPHPLSVRLPN